MLVRREVCRHVTCGDINGDLQTLRNNFPTVLDGASNVAFLLHTKKFIEMVVGGATPEETVSYGKAHLGDFQFSGDALRGAAGGGLLATRLLRARQ